MLATLDVEVAAEVAGNTKPRWKTSKTQHGG